MPPALTDSTPGTARNRASNSRKKEDQLACGYRCTGRLTGKVNTWLELKPGSVLSRFIRLHEQSCGGKQRGGKGHLTDHESLARTIQAAAFTCRLRPFLQAVHQICFGSAKCRSKTENDCRSY